MKQEFVEHRHPEGVEFANSKVHLFFGNRRATTEFWQSSSAPSILKKLKQVHGDTIVAVSKESPVVEADAQWTDQAGLTLLIATADCLPVLMWDPLCERVAAVHAGWRGVANAIVAKTVRELTAQGSCVQNLQIWIGPHIRQSSFEVEESLAQEICQTVPQAKPWIASGTEGRVLVDLEQVVQQQLVNLDVALTNIRKIKIDTRTDLSWHSYRRDRESSGRNLSGIRLRGSKRS